MILFIAFAAILMITFGVMVIVTRPSEGQKAVDRRMVDIRSNSVELQQSSSGYSQLLKQEQTSSMEWLDNLLERYKISTYLETRIAQSNSKTSVSKLLSTSAGLAVLGFAVSYLVVSVLLVQIIVALVLGYVPFGLVMHKRSRRIAAFEKGLPDAIDMMSRALRAGHSMIAAIGVLAEQASEPIASEFSEVFKQQNFGVPLRDALTQMLDHVPSQDLRVLVTGVLVQKETGGNLVEILDRIAMVIRERMRIQGEIRTHTAQGRLTGWILCSLPIVMLVLINMINPGYSKVLLDTPLGKKLMYTGVALLATGGFIIRQIMNGIEV